MTSKALKVLFSVLAVLMVSALGFAADAESSEATLRAAAYIGAGVCVGAGAGGTGAGIGLVVKGMLEGLARNPGLAGKLTTNMFIGVALVETCVIYALVIAFLLLFVL